MKTLFYIVVKMKVHDGMIDYGRFFVGDDSEFAGDLYQKLEGHLDPESQFMLHIDLIEDSGDTSIIIQRKGCSLEELTENCRLITRETFKFLNLEK
jgi:hypothetical protein